MTKNKLLLAALIAASFLLPTALPAQSFSIEIGDRPHYTHGPRYWEGDWEMVWIGGHWSEHGHHWVHGHYRRGEHRRHHDFDDHHHDHHDH